MTTLSELQQGTVQTKRIAIVRPSAQVLFVDEVAVTRTALGFDVIENTRALLAAYPGAEIIEVAADQDIAPGYVWQGDHYGPPSDIPRFAPYEVFALFTEAERGRFFSALDAGSVNVRSVAEMLRLNSGAVLEGTHPVLQAALYVLRTEGIIDSDARLTEVGNQLQGIAP